MAAIPALRRQRQEDGRMGRLESLEPAWAVTNKLVPVPTHKKCLLKSTSLYNFLIYITFVFPL